MIFSLHQLGAVMHMQSAIRIQHSPLSPYTRHIGAWISVVVPFYSSPQRHNPAPLQVLNHQRTGRRSERTLEPSKNGHVANNHLQMQQGSPFLPIIIPPQSSLWYPWSHKHHLSNPTIVYPVPL